MEEGVCEEFFPVPEGGKRLHFLDFFDGLSQFCYFMCELSFSFEMIFGRIVHECILELDACFRNFMW